MFDTVSMLGVVAELRAVSVADVAKIDAQKSLIGSFSFKNIHEHSGLSAHTSDEIVGLVHVEKH